MSAAPSDGPRVAIVGTFDVSNFGDLLFPLIAEAELAERLPDVEVRRYSYRRMTAGPWPYSVGSLADLAGDLSETDLLVVGGGHLVRFDKAVADGYAPTTPDEHHPTGYWLTPTLLAHAYGIPVAWNALGVSPDTPAWGRPLLAEAMAATDYVSVRDEWSAQELASIAPDAEIAIVPDTAWSVRTPATAEAVDPLLAQMGATKPYIVVQPSPLLLEHAADVRAAVTAAHELGRSVVELPISPALGDRSGLLELPVPVSRPTEWPAPPVLVSLIANADAVIAQSLHLSITALAAGVPVHRVRAPRGSKYELLESLAGVSVWNGERDGATAIREALAARGDDGDDQGLLERHAQLEAHWDRIAALVGERRAPDLQSAARAISGRTAALETLAGGQDERSEWTARVETLEQQVADLEYRLAEKPEPLDARALAEERDSLLHQLADAERDRAVLLQTQQELRRLDEYTQTLLASPAFRVWAPLRRLARRVRR